MSPTPPTAWTAAQATADPQALPRERMRIAFITNELSRAGAETQMMLVARCLKQRGHDVTVISILEPTSYVENLYLAGVPVRTLVGRTYHAGDHVPKRVVLRGIGPGIRLLKRWRPQALVCFVHEASLFGRLIGRLAGVPVVIGSERSVWGGGRVDRLITASLDRLLDETVVNARHVAADLVASGVVPCHRVQVIPNGVDVDGIAAARSARQARRAELGIGDEFVWIAVGRLTTEKDHRSLLTAFAQARRSAPDARLLLVGEGVLRDELEMEATRAGLEGRVHFLGKRSDVPELLAAADAMVMSSQWEGLPNAIMEACAAGLPVVSTAVGAIPELVEDGLNGRLVPPEDSGALAEAMQWLMASPADGRAAMGAASEARVRAGYGLEAAASQWEDLIARHASRRRRGRRRGTPTPS